MSRRLYEGITQGGSIDVETSQDITWSEPDLYSYDRSFRLMEEKNYELAEWRGNVVAVVSDLKIALNSTTYTADVVSYSDYSPYGVQLDGRYYAGGDYRYGFQGQETDDEIKGKGNSVNYKYRMHDPRLGRFFAVDPLASKAPGWTPYRFCFDNPIYFVDPDGRFEGDYFDSETGAYLGTDGVNDGIEYKINKNDFANIARSSGFSDLSNEDKKGWLSGVANSPVYHHEYSQSAGCIGTPKTSQGQTAGTSVSSSNSPSPSSNGASNANNLLSKTALGSESAMNLKNVDAPNTRSFLKGAGLATTIIEGVTIVENAVETGDYKQAGIEAVTLGFETVVIDRMITTPNPYTIGAGVAYYILKAMFVPCPDCGPAPLPENWDQLRDQDNTRTGGTGGGF